MFKNVIPSVWIGVKQTQDGDFGAESFARAGRRPDQDVLVGVVQVVERLGLDGVELGHRVLVQGPVSLVPEREPERRETLLV